MKLYLLKIAAFLLGLFALLTLFMSGAVLLDLFGIREKEGNYVPFVVWANLVCGFIYLTAVYGLFKKQKWTVFPLLIAVTVLILTFGALLIYVSSGGIYEAKTIAAMLFRITVTLAFTLLAFFKIKK